MQSPVYQWFQNLLRAVLSSQGLTSVAEVATLNRTRMNSSQECLTIEGPHNFISTLPSVCTSYLFENAATGNIKINPKCCHAKYFAFCT